MNKADIEILREQAQTNVYMAHGDVSKADCILGFSFGYIDNNGKILPGKSNVQLASFIEHRLPPLPLIVQFEIADALEAVDPILTIREHRQAGEYLNSREIAEQALVFMQSHDWQTAIIVTHPAMEARNDAICKKLGILTVLPTGLASIEYDVKSAQPWTQDANSWWKREDKVIDTCRERNWL